MRHAFAPRDPVARPSRSTPSGADVAKAADGLVALVNSSGAIVATLPVPGADGLLLHHGRILIASRSEIRELDADLTESKRLISLPSFNHLHSMRVSGQNIMVASTGVDAIIETDLEGNVAWEWWATREGFDRDSSGRSRKLDVTADHREIEYPNSQHVTHVNSAVPFTSQKILATFYNQGILAAIDRRSGVASVLLDGLGQPHSVRLSSNGYVTLADTLNGRAIMLEVQPDCSGAHVVQSVPIHTRWLQDALFDGLHWWLVDGWNAMVLKADQRGNVIDSHQFNPDWRLYEVMPRE